MKKPIVLLCVLFLFGFLCGLFLLRFKPISTVIDIKNNTSYFSVFVNSFTMNFWYLFLMWLCNLNINTLLFSVFILILKGVVMGVYLRIFFLTFSMVGIGKFLIENFSEFIIIIPLMFLIILSNKDNEKKNLIIVFFGCIIYSLFETFI